MNIEKAPKPTLIIADDETDILEFLTDDLEEDYHILPATNGKEVMELLENNSVQLIISDIMMPEMDGYELCAALKSNIEYSHIPLILLTAKNTLESKIKGLEEGADAYIEKPFSPAHLQAQIQSLLSNRFKIRLYFHNSPLVPINSMAYTNTDKEFLDQINQLITDNLINKDLSVEFLAEKLHISRATLYRKIKGVSDLTPNELINLSRLKKAAELLQQGHLKIFEVAYAVGFNSQTHFGRNFQKQFGLTPSEYAKKDK